MDSSRINPQFEVILSALLPLFAIVAALLIGAIMLLILGANPFEAYLALLEGAFGSVNALSETTVKAIPLLLVGLGICISFRADVINIGGEGQMVVGALAATAVALAFPNWPPGLLLPAVMVAGFLAGAIYGGIPGVLKAYANVNEILSTIMLNIVAVQAMNFLLRGIMIDPFEIEMGTRIPQTRRLPEAADLPILIPDTRLHAGVIIAVILAILVYIFLWRTTIGYRIRAVGLNPHASRYAGIQVKRYVVLALALSGAFAGLAGAILVFGSESHRMVTDGSTTGFTGSAGFNGIVAALFGGLHPLTTIPASFLFGALLVGANKLQRAVQVPAALIGSLNGLVVVFVVASEVWRRRLQQRREARSIALEHESPDTVEEGS